MSQSVCLLARPEIGVQRLLATFSERRAEDLTCVGKSFDFRLGRSEENEFQIWSACESFYFLVKLDQEFRDIGIEEILENELAPKELKLDVSQRNFLSCRFNDFPFARACLFLALRDLEAEASKVWMDTDYGWFIRGDELLASLQREPDLDWRHEET